MAAHKSIDKICAVCAVVALLIAMLFSCGAFGITATETEIGYESRLFSTDKVHTIDIVMDDWDSFIEDCQSEEYSLCSVVIDGDALKNVAIRAKGNTSLSSVSAMNSDRYSFKIEFDHYDSSKTYYGLDKLNLNNIIQDTTYMKDYLSYTLMRNFGVDTPLCSYVYITVNGEDWGLYLAVEGVEDAFLEKNYSSEGSLYKPDSQSNSVEADMSDAPDDNFDMSDMSGGDFDTSDMADGNFNMSQKPGGADFNPEDTAADSSEADPGADDSDTSENTDSSFSPPDMPDGSDFDMSQMPDGGSFDFSDISEGFSGVGSSDVKLQYIDDDPDSYSNIFDNAKTDISDSDKTRLISSLRQLSENENIEEIVDVDEVIRYFVVHIFLCNDDSYTGTMIHNYYLYENNGKLSMIPWDYNLAFGTFQGGDATSEVNSPIDTPVSGSTDDRPMLAWIFNNAEYTEMYHEYFAEFLSTADISSVIDETAALISEYVEKDPTAFYSYEEFETGVETLRSFCELRTESIEGQLEGTIPSTSSGQSEDSSALVDASSLTLSDMGTMNNSGGQSMPGGFGGDIPDFDGSSDRNMPDFNGSSDGNMPDFEGQAPPDMDNSFESGAAVSALSEDETASAENADDKAAASDKDFSSDSFSPSSGFSMKEKSASGNNSDVIYLAVSAGVLAAGLIFALLFKGHNR